VCLGCPLIGHRRKCGESLQSINRDQTKYHFGDSSQVRSLVWNMPAKSNGGLGCAVVLCKVCTLVAHRWREVVVCVCQELCWMKSEMTRTFSQGSKAGDETWPYSYNLETKQQSCKGFISRMSLKFRNNCSLSYTRFQNVSSSSGWNAGPDALTQKGTTLKVTVMTNNKSKRIFCYCLSLGTFWYAVVDIGETKN
jgi:hypothetical protein